MRLHSSFIPTCIVCLVGCAPALTAQGTSTCRLADQSSALVQAEVTGIATGTDSLSQAARDSTGIPATTTAKISYITDSRTCDKAVAALNVTLQTPGLARRVYVVKVDIAYAVVDPELAFAPGTSAVFVFDRKWKHQDTMLH